MVGCRCSIFTSEGYRSRLPASSRGYAAFLAAQSNPSEDERHGGGGGEQQPAHGRRSAGLLEVDSRSGLIALLFSFFEPTISAACFQNPNAENTTNMFHPVDTLRTATNRAEWCHRLGDELGVYGARDVNNTRTVASACQLAQVRCRPASFPQF